MTDTITDKSELLEKCRLVTMKCGREHLDDEGKSHNFSLQDLVVHYSIDWGGRQYISVKDNSDRILLMSWNDNKNDNPVELPTINEFKVNFYEQGTWEQRINDIYSVITFKTNV